LSHTFPIQNGLKQDALSPLLFKKVQENQVDLELDATLQLSVYVKDINLLGDSKNTIKEDTETLLETNKDVGLEINAENTKYNHVSSSKLRTEPEYKDS
jgi:hypothetical protein